jgi:hypothetical protein
MKDPVPCQPPLTIGKVPITLAAFVLKYDRDFDYKEIGK